MVGCAKPLPPGQYWKTWRWYTYDPDYTGPEPTTTCAPWRCGEFSVGRAGLLGKTVSLCEVCAKREGYVW